MSNRKENMVADNINQEIKNIAIDICIYEKAIEKMKKSKIDESDNGYKLIQEEKRKSLNLLKIHCLRLGLDYSDYYIHTNTTQI